MTTTQAKSLSLEFDENASASTIVEHLFEEATRRAASDIHLEITKDKWRVRLRIHGKLVQWIGKKTAKGLEVCERLQFMAGMRIANKHTPQDGKISWQKNDVAFDARVSFLPANDGASLVIRLFYKAKTLRLDYLMPQYMLEPWKNAIRHANGIILVTGPTGSGKSTTLYATLNEINTPETKIITIEDPVETTVDGLVQVHVREEAGLTFASALRSILRQDPDVILVGEIRDEETATIATRSALTGHLVFSTLHTNSAVATIDRLIDMKLPAYLVANTLRAVLAQRLLPVLCQDCIEEIPVPDDIVQRIKPQFERHDLATPTTMAFAKGCPSCLGTGIVGRIPVFELLIPTEQTKKHLDPIDHEAIAKDLVMSFAQSAYPYLCGTSQKRVSLIDYLELCG